MLEFWIDPQKALRQAIFQEDKKFVFHCAGGLRSALAAKTAQDMGLKPVAHMGGGFAAWRDAGGPVRSGSRRRNRFSRHSGAMRSIELWGALAPLRIEIRVRFAPRNDSKDFANDHHQ